MAEKHAANSSSHTFTRLENFLSEVDMNHLIFPGIKKKFKFEEKDLIYKDNIGTVQCYAFTPLSRDIAIKKVPIPLSRSCTQQGDEKFRLLCEEIRNFRALSPYPHIVDFYGICKHEGVAWIFMELMDFSLKEVYMSVHESFAANNILSTSAAFPENIMGVIAIRIIDALSFCQSKGIMHRDIKPDNILLNDEGKVKLCDFGVSKKMQGLTMTFVGTIAYMPPERLKMPRKSQRNKGNSSSSQYVRYEYRSDVWSVGITLAELAYGRLPYILNRREKDRLIYNLPNHILNTEPLDLIDRCFGTKYSNGVRDFVKSCLLKINKRPTFNALMLKNFYMVNVPNNNDQFVIDFIQTYFHRNTSPLATPSQVSHTSTLTEKDSSANTSKEHGVLCEKTDVKKVTPSNSLKLKSTPIPATKNGIITKNRQPKTVTPLAANLEQPSLRTSSRKRKLNAQDFEGKRSNKTKILRTKTSRSIVTQTTDAV